MLVEVALRTPVRHTQAVGVSEPELLTGDRLGPPVHRVHRTNGISPDHR